MKKNLPIIMVIIILTVIVTFTIFIVVKEYNLNRPIVLDSAKELSTQDEMEKARNLYSTQDEKESFLKQIDELQLAVTNIILDGSVTNKDELKNEINEINNILKTDDWQKIGLKYPNHWMGNWSLDNDGKVMFSFKYENIKPDWAMDKDVVKYIK